MRLWKSACFTDDHGDTQKNRIDSKRMSRQEGKYTKIAAGTAGAGTAGVQHQHLRAFVYTQVDVDTLLQIIVADCQ